MAQDCWINGFPGYLNDRNCEVSEVYKDFETLANEKCSQGSQACNPIVYGYGACLETGLQDFESKCEAAINGDFAGDKSKALEKASEQLYMDLQLVCDVDFGVSGYEDFCEMAAFKVDSILDVEFADAGESDSLISFLEDLSGSDSDSGEVESPDLIHSREFLFIDDSPREEVEIHSLTIGKSDVDLHVVESKAGMQKVAIVIDGQAKLYEMEEGILPILTQGFLTDLKLENDKVLFDDGILGWSELSAKFLNNVEYENESLDCSALSGKWECDGLAGSTVFEIAGDLVADKQARCHENILSVDGRSYRMVDEGLKVKDGLEVYYCKRLGLENSVQVDNGERDISEKWGGSSSNESKVDPNGASAASD